MLNSFFLMFSLWNKNSKATNIFKIIWIIYAVAASFSNFNPLFSIINICVFMFVTSAINYTSKIQPKLNSFLSIISVLIYSLFIDTVCYYGIPSWSVGQSLIEYITNGLLFNYKYVFVNMSVMLIAVLILKTLDKYNFKFKSFLKNQY